MPTAVKTRNRKRKLSFEQELGRNVGNQRRELGLTQMDLATNVGCSVQMITKVEQGTVSASVPMLRDIASALGKELRDLLPDSLT